MKTEDKIKYLESFSEKTYQDLIELGAACSKVITTLGIDFEVLKTMDEDEQRSYFAKTIFKTVTDMAIPDPRDVISRLTGGKKKETVSDKFEFIMTDFAPLISEYMNQVQEKQRTGIVAMPADFQTIINEPNE